VGVHVVGAVLRVVFNDENGRVIPVRTVGDGFDYSTHRKIVVGDRSCRARLLRRGTVRVIVREVEQYERRQLVAVSVVSSPNETFKFVQELVGAELVGILRVEVRKSRIKVIAQRCEGWPDSLQKR